MHRRPTSSDDDTGQDSFLDIVANIVGILIILVLVAGLRVKNAAASAQADADDEAVAASRDLQDARNYFKSLQHDIHDLDRRKGRLEAEQAKKNSDQVAWTAAVGKMRERLDTARSQLDDRQRRQFDLSREIDATREQLQHVAEQYRLASQAPEAIEIEVLPTPLARTVNDQEHELHFRLINGRIAHVPLNELLDDIIQSVRRQSDKLRDHDVLDDTVGPRNGFSLRYRFEQVRDPRSLSGYRPTFRYAAIIPSGHEPAERTDEALAAGSRFRQTLSGADRRRATVTLWVYPDSSATFRSVRKYLYQDNWRVSGRPLPFNSPIAVTPSGTKSAAQ